MFTPVALLTAQPPAPAAWTPPGSPLMWVDPNVAPTGTTVADESGNGRTGTLSNGASHVASSPSYYDFAGASTQYILWSDFGDPYNSVTTAFWAYTNSTANQALLSKWNDTGNNRAWHTVINPFNSGTGRVGLLASKTGGWAPNIVVEQAGPAITTGAWRFYSQRYDGSTGNFYNAYSDASTWDGAWNQTDQWDNGGTDPVYNSTAEWVFGSYQNGSPASYSLSYTGRMGHLFIYNSYLSDSDVNDIFTNTKSYYGL